jgi:predicted Zn finger-like uncharacterized protein
MPIQIRCPSCEATLRVPDNLLGKAVKCPKCKTTFTADDGTGPSENIQAQAPARPSSASRRPRAPEPEEEIIEDFEEVDDEEERPRRRRRGGRRAAAEQAVSGPAIALMVVGGLGLLVAIANLVLTVMGVAVFGAAAVAPKGAGGGFNPAPEAAGYAAGRLIGTILSFCWPAIVLSGAIQMKRLQSFGYAMTACIVAMLPCNLCCLLGLPFGIWGLVVLNRSDVKDAF